MTTTTVLPGTWVVDPATTTAAFQARGIAYDVHGTIPVTAGTVEVDAAGTPTAIEAVLDASGIATGNDRRDRDLRSRRFLGTDEHPVLRFSGRSAASDGGWTVTGTLRVRGAETPLELAVRTGDGATATERRVVATAVLDLRDAGIRVPSLLVRRRVVIRVTATLLAG